ncbi:hypothetical protein PsYK624_162080 [Phanerochaete sordida]|uniref:DUF6534 domain-containing protein n=1 Tax=Phanerochaete sordida TaxID=48140 RepID=A0A9P3GQH9_9APHY|nr:hypothetical protein PsYK624_162080 [Phanerochaete sordida]
MDSPLAPLVPPASVLNETLGALLLGGFARILLYGVFCQQCFTFFRRFSREGAMLKYSIWALLFLSSLHIAFTIHPVYILLVSSVGKILVPGQVPWSVAASTIVTMASDLIVRSWFMYRVWILSDRCLALIVPPLVCQLFIVAVAARVIILGTLYQPQNISDLFLTILAVIVVTDFYVAVCVCWFMYRRGQNASSRTRSLLKTLTVYIINSGLVTSAFWLVCMITHATMPRNFVFLAFLSPVTGLYENCLLASLNARDWFRHEMHGAASIRLTPQGSSAIRHFSGLSYKPDVPETTSDSHSRSFGSGHGVLPGHVAIQVDREEAKAVL